MTRDAFLAKLRDGLRGLPPGAVDEVLADYEAHFSEAAAAGRTDAQVAQALGDPGRLARELRAEQGLRRWEQERTPGAAAGAIIAVLGLLTVDVFIVLPILLTLGGIMFGFFMGAIGVFIGGGWLFASSLFGGLPAGDVTPGALPVALGGFGLMSVGVATAALIAAALIALVNLLVRYGRLHYRLLQPAIAN